MYDLVDQVTGIYDYKANGTALASFVYSYDSANRLATEVDNGGATKTYTYNVADELKADGTATYMFDGAGNRANSGYAVTGGNEMTNDGTWTCDYDAVGNLTARLLCKSGPRWLTHGQWSGIGKFPSAFFKMASSRKRCGGKTADYGISSGVEPIGGRGRIFPSGVTQAPI